LKDDIDGALVRDIDLLCLDAGNTVIFLDHARLAALCAREGFATTAGALDRAEGQTKVALEEGSRIEPAWSQAQIASARGWAATVGTMLVLAGLAPDRAGRMLDAIWPEHCARNLWSVVPRGLAAALERTRAAGVRVALVSNSEGMLERLLDELGILSSFDLILDSGVVGIEKPDPRIFRIALDRFHVPPSRALHLGDNFPTDVLGARAAGMRVALVDPFGHLAGRHADVQRVPGAPEVADAIARTTRRDVR
jgi:HAD superfamily hydrolase (TIGR01509 family)